MVGRNRARHSDARHVRLVKARLVRARQTSTAKHGRTESKACTAYHGKVGGSSPRCGGCLRGEVQLEKARCGPYGCGTAGQAGTDPDWKRFSISQKGPGRKPGALVFCLSARGFLVETERISHPATTGTSAPAISVSSNPVFPKDALPIFSGLPSARKNPPSRAGPR